MSNIEILKKVSKFESVVGLNWFYPSRAKLPTETELRGYRRAQDLALKAAKEVAQLVQEGWTEIETAKTLEIYLRDCGVKSFFHRPFVWFGERTRFDGVDKIKDFLPTKKKVKAGDAMILDVAPIFKNYCVDIGYTTSLGVNVQVEKANRFLAQLKSELPHQALKYPSGSGLYRWVDNRITEAGYENRHRLYPLGVLGHRLFEAPDFFSGAQFMRFGWQAYVNLLSRGGFSQALSDFSEQPLTGMWAIEPHIGGASFGAKFEEILVVENEKAYWLSEMKL